MARDASLRIKRWQLRFTTDSQSMSPAMKRLIDDTEHVVENRFVSETTAMCAMEDQVRGVVDALGASVITYPFYLAFGREMRKLTQKISGESAAMGAAILITKWQSRGLSQPVLEAIRTGVFSVGPPASP